LYQPMYSTMARLALSRVGQTLVSISSPFSEAKTIRKEHYPSIGRCGRGTATRHSRWPSQRTRWKCMGSPGRHERSLRVQGCGLRRRWPGRPRRARCADGQRWRSRRPGGRRCRSRWPDTATLPRRRRRCRVGPQCGVRFSPSPVLINSLWVPWRPGWIGCAGHGRGQGLRRSHWPWRRVEGSSPGLKPYRSC
jgi:hypothetical protein